MNRVRLLSTVVCLCLLAAGHPCANAADDGGVIARKILRQLVSSPEDRDLLEMLRASLINVADQDDLGDLMVIYCLGCYYTGQDAKADSVKPIIVRKCPTSESLKYLSSRFTREACSACGSSGKRTAACSACGGGGRCSTCGGKGYRLMQGIGKMNKATCGTCKSKGQCGTCAGKGRETKTCSSCGGMGQRTSRARVRSVYLSLLKGNPVDEDAIAAMAEPPRTGGSSTLPAVRRHTSPSEPPAVSTPRPSSGDTEKQMNAYVKSMGRLDRMFAESKFHESSLTEVKALPDRHIGKLIKSRAYMISCYPREVVIATRSSSPRSDGTSLIPRSLEVGMKALELYEKIGKGKRVVVTYGVVSADNCTLFNIEAL